MAITYDTATNYSNNVAFTTAQTFAHTVGGGSNRYLFCLISTEDFSTGGGAQTPSSVTYNGNALASDGIAKSGSVQTAAIYSGQDAVLGAAGSHNISISYSGEVNAIIVHVLSCDEMEQQVAEANGSLVQLSTTNTGGTSNVTTVTDGALIIAMCGNDEGTAGGSGTVTVSWNVGTEILDTANSLVGGASLRYEKATAGAQAITATTSENVTRFCLLSAAYAIYAPTAPDPPTGLTATNDGATIIDLSWTAPVDDGGSAITAYKIERESPVSGGWADLVTNTGNTNTTYQDSGLAAGTQYNYRVSAINAIGTSTPSTAANDTTDAASAPGAPTSLAAVGETATTVYLTWVAPASTGGSPITGYKIERESPTGGGFSTIVADTGNTDTSYRDTGLTTATEYNYKVSAINGAGTGTASTADAATTPNVPNQTHLAYMAFALNLPILPRAEGAVLEQIDRQHLLRLPRSPVVVNLGSVVVAQQEQWAYAGI